MSYNRSYGNNTGFQNNIKLRFGSISKTALNYDKYHMLDSADCITCSGVRTQTLQCKQCFKHTTNKTNK